MSDAEDIQIQLGTVKTRTVVQERAWPCAELSTYVGAYGDADASELPIYVRLAALEGIESHAISSLKAEVGGALLGGVYRHEGKVYVQVESYLPARNADEQRARLTFTHETWKQLYDEREQKHPDLSIVGWYDTHPDLGVFLSDDDKFIQRNFFGEEEQIALVVDPVANERAFFRQSNGKLPKLPGFYVFGDASSSGNIETVLDKMRTKPQAAPRHTPPARNNPTINRIIFAEPCLNLYYFLPRMMRRWLGILNAETAPRISIKNVLIVALLVALVYMFVTTRPAPPQELIHIEYAKAFSAAGDYEESVREYRRYLVHKPDDEAAREGLLAALKKLSAENNDVSAVYENEIAAAREAANRAARNGNFGSAYRLYRIVAAHTQEGDDRACESVFGFLAGSIASRPSKADADVVLRFFVGQDIGARIEETDKKNHKRAPKSQGARYWPPW